MSLNLRAAVVTDPGLIRSNNEDSAFAGHRLIVVADGMGGLPAGELASDIVLRNLRPLEDLGAEASASDADAGAAASELGAGTGAADVATSGPGVAGTPGLSLDEPAGGDPVDQGLGGDEDAGADGEITAEDATGPLSRLLAAVEAANDEIGATAAEEAERHGMGTTVTSMLLDDDRVALVHVGDSRAYLFRGGEFAQLTTDDTYVQMLVDRGEITAEAARAHPQRSLVTQALQGGPIDPHCLMLDPQLGDRYLICSDGLTDVIADDKIAGILGSFADPSECAERLVKLTLAAGAPDNVTVIVADVDDTN